MTKASTIAEHLLKFFGTNGQRWTRGNWAKNKSGHGVAIYSSEAKTFCLLGAMSRLNITRS